MPTGTITFTIDGVARPPAAVNASGTATVTATFTAGSHTLSATYSGDSNFQPSSSGTLAQSVSSSNNNPPSNSDANLTVYANPNIPTLGDTVTLMVNISSEGAVPYGTVQFYDGTTLLATAPVVGGRATQTIPTTSLGNAGSHNITVTYSGDGTNNPVSKNFGLLVNRIPLVLSLTSNLTASVYGQAVTFTAKAASPAPPGVSLPSGQLQLVDANGVVATGSMSKGTAVTNVTTLDAGSHQVAASFAGDINWVPAKSTALPQAIAKAQTAVALAALPDVSGAPQVTVTQIWVSRSRRRSSRWDGPVRRSRQQSRIGHCPGGGRRRHRYLERADRGFPHDFGHLLGYADYVDSKSPDVTHISVANTAGYSAYHAAPNESCPVFGANLASGSASAAAVPLPLSLAGTSVKITDQAGVDHTAPLYFAAPNQINLLIPSEVPLGPVRITVTNANGDTFPIVTAATGTSPGLFAANADGRSIAAAQVVQVFKDGSQSVENVAKLDPAQKLFVPAPISFGSEQLFLTLYGTGIRHTQGQSSVTCTINGQDLPILFAGAQPTFLGLDQINVRLPASFAGTGVVTVVVRVDGQAYQSRDPDIPVIPRRGRWHSPFAADH